jgi:Auxiliary Activity family 9 (formerly GH61)
VSPTQYSFFKIWEGAYDPKKKLWINEEMINNDRKMTFQLPSDLKPGVYTLRSELIALHYSSTQGPQVYPHCFNIYINGTGTATPTGVRFPGGYAPKERALTANLYDRAGKPLNWDKYVAPGPPKYAGKYDRPQGPKPVVSEKDRGVFPADFQVKYDALKKKWDEEGLTFGDKLNQAQMGLGHNEVKSESNLGSIFAKHFSVQRRFENELAQLRREAIKLGIAQ